MWSLSYIIKNAPWVIGFEERTGVSYMEFRKCKVAVNTQNSFKLCKIKVTSYRVYTITIDNRKKAVN